MSDRTTEFYNESAHGSLAIPTFDDTEPAADDRDDVTIEEFVETPPFPNPFWHPIRAAAWIVRLVFGLLCLILLLAVTAAIPLVFFVALGYLLECQGRIARTGKLRHAFPLLNSAARMGSIVFGVWLWVLPLYLLAGAAADARLIDPEGTAAQKLQTGTSVAAVLVAVHLCLALARGGSLGCFFRPIKNVIWFIARLREGDYWERAELNVGEFVERLRFKHHFSLGVRGFVGAFAWLFLPTALLAATSADNTQAGSIVITVLGGLCLVLVFSWLPFLLARFTAENRLRAMFELRTIRRLFANAPLSWLFAIVVTYVLALPLYLLKVRLPPDDAMWLVTIVFITSIFPAKVFAGWAYHRAVRRDKQAWRGFRWIARLVMVPLLGLYVFLVFFTQTISEHGRAALFEHHAFLLPVPF